MPTVGHCVYVTVFFRCICNFAALQTASFCFHFQLVLYFKNLNIILKLILTLLF
jgi:hypothetical protein